MALTSFRVQQVVTGALWIGLVVSHLAYTQTDWDHRSLKGGSAHWAPCCICFAFLEQFML